MTTQGGDKPDNSKVVPLTARPDLQILPMHGGRRTIKDPVSLQYYRLSPEEYSIFSMLNGRTTFHELLTGCQKQFPGIALSLESLNGFLGELLRNGLVTAPFSGLGKSLAQRSQSQQQSDRIAAWLNPFSVRISGLDPEQLLKRGDRLIGVLLSPIALAGYVILIATALAVVALRLEVLAIRLPLPGSILTPEHLLMSGLVFLAIKVLHELAHAAVCRHFGGECHDLGVLFIVCMPLFYCDVSDSWMLDNRWKRIAVSAAGIGLELVIAAAATLLWWYSISGPLHDLFLSVMLVCSVNTVLFNGNPLLRYDGYHVLADLVDIPNLSAQARRMAWSTFDRVILGSHDSHTTPYSSAVFWFLLIYAVASSVYRVVVVAAIGWFVLTIANQLELKLAGALLVLPLAASVVIPFVRTLTSRVKAIGGQTPNRRRRSITGIVGLLIAVAALLWWPIPYSVTSPFVIVPGDAVAIHAHVPGRLDQALTVGSVVNHEQTIAELANVDLQLQKATAATRVSQLRERVNHLQATRSVNDPASLQLPIAQDALAAAQQQLSQLVERTAQLNVISPRDGTILPARSTQQAPGVRRTLWSRHTIDPENHGDWITESNILCYVGDPNRLNANVLVDDAQIEHLRVGQSVTLILQSAAGESLSGTVQEISSLVTHDVPPELIAAGMMVASGPASPPQWQVTVQVDENVKSTALYSPGRAKIHCGRMTLAARIADTIRRTFAAEL